MDEMAFMFFYFFEWLGRKGPWVGRLLAKGQLDGGLHGDEMATRHATPTTNTPPTNLALSSSEGRRNGLPSYLYLTNDMLIWSGTSGQRSDFGELAWLMSGEITGMSRPPSTHGIFFTRTRQRGLKAGWRLCVHTNHKKIKEHLQS